jgi:hypothetical protein
MSDGPDQPAIAPLAAEPPDRNPHRPRKLLVVLVVLILAYAFGRPISEGYYFGGCDEAAHTRHFITHTLGFKMCRDETEEAKTETHTAPMVTTPAAEAPPAHEYTSPCSLYVKGHNALLTITGSEAAADCERFVSRSDQPFWTTEAQAPTGAQTVVCEVTNDAQEHALVTDTGGHEYGSEACTQLSGEGWG